MTSRAAAVACLATACLVASGVRAADYGQFIEVETEEDLRELLLQDELDDEQFEALAELLEDGLDLNTASREDLYVLPNLTYQEVDGIIAYREEAGAIRNPTDLLAAGILSARKLEAIAPFLLVVEEGVGAFVTKGRIRYKTTYVAGDDQVPSMWLGGKVSTLKHLDLGLTIALIRTHVSDIRYDPNRRGLSAEKPSVTADVPKFHIQWKDNDIHLVAGTYRIGFGQRLTFDNTSRPTPNGIRIDDKMYLSQDLTSACRESEAELTSPCLEAARYEYMGPDYRWTNRLMGLAFGLPKIKLGDDWLQVYAWGSYQIHDIYQYEIYAHDEDRCANPRSDDDICDAPWVYVRQGDVLADTTRMSYTTLRDMYTEAIGGLNFSYFIDRRTHFGLTGYVSYVNWLVDGVELDFQEWSTKPFGGIFGAVGIDLAWGQDIHDLFFEVTRSFDGQPEGGGFAAIARYTATFKKHELETALRYYGRDYANPYARPISEPDEYEGLRARDELGVRTKYVGSFDDFHLRALLDLWGPLSSLRDRPEGSDEDEVEPAAVPKLRLVLRGDYEVTPWFWPGLQFEYHDRDLTDAGRRNCFDQEFSSAREGEPEHCQGEKIRIAAQFKFIPLRELRFALRYQHTFVDDSSSDFNNKFRQDASGWFTMMYKPIPDLRLMFRLSYRNEDIESDDRLEHELWGYIEASYWYERIFWFKFRYELSYMIPPADPNATRDSILYRDPNPAHWLRLELEARF